MRPSTLTAEQEAVKAEFIELRGTWSESWESVLLLDPEFLRRYLYFSVVPWRQNHLADKVKEFIYIAIDASATHMYLPGVRQHIRTALGFGATPAEIMEVLELSAMLGVHTMEVGVPILQEALRAVDQRDGGRDATSAAGREEVRKAFISRSGSWPESWDDLLDTAPELMREYTEFASVPWRVGPLEPKVKELVGIAVDAAATHLYGVGLKRHIANALRLGATREEILEVLAIASVLGIHAVTASAPILAEEAARVAGSSSKDHHD